MTTDRSVPNTPAPYQDDDEIDLLDLLIVLARNKFFIIGTALLFSVIAAGATFFMTPAYKATSRFVPVRFDSPISVGIIADVVKSRPLLSDIVLQMKLGEIWNTPNPNTAIKSLGDSISFQAEKSSQSMTVTAELSDPQLAADVANAIVAETEKRLYTLHEEQLAFVRKRKVSLEAELREAQRELTKAEESLAKTVSSYNESTPELKKELSDYGSNPDTEGITEGISETNTSVLQQLPDGGAAYLEALRTVRTNETFYYSLISQFSKVLEQEKAEPISLQILEKASVPEQRSKPRRTLIVVMACFLGGFLGIFGAFIREFARNAKKNPERKAKLQELSSAMKFSCGRKDRT